MIKLNIWEQIAIGTAISILTFLSSKVKNQLELEALQSAIQFLQQLLQGTVAEKMPSEPVTPK